MSVLYAASSFKPYSDPLWTQPLTITPRRLQNRIRNKSSVRSIHDVIGSETNLELMHGLISTYDLVVSMEILPCDRRLKQVLEDR